jgi:hypothetical protein
MRRKARLITADELLGIAARKAREEARKEEARKEEAQKEEARKEEARKEEESSDFVKLPTPALTRLDIDKTTELVELFGSIILLLSQVFQGRKINKITAVINTVRAFVSNRDVFKNMPEVWDEIRDLSDSERKILSSVLSDYLQSDPTQEQNKELIERASQGIIDIVTLACKQNV